MRGTTWKERRWAGCASVAGFPFPFPSTFPSPFLSVVRPDPMRGPVVICGTSNQAVGDLGNVSYPAEQFFFGANSHVLHFAWLKL